jgi:predicted nucleic acid-binding protein
MIGVDTNVLVRILVADSPDQASRARALVEEIELRGEQIFLNRLVLAESLWVMSSRYGSTRSEALAAIQLLTELPTFSLEDRNAWERAIERVRQGPQQLVDEKSSAKPMLGTVARPRILSIGWRRAVHDSRYLPKVKLRRASLPQ